MFQCWICGTTLLQESYNEHKLLYLYMPSLHYEIQVIHFILLKWPFPFQKAFIWCQAKSKGQAFLLEMESALKQSSFQLNLRSCFATITCCGWSWCCCDWSWCCCGCSCTNSSSCCCCACCCVNAASCCWMWKQYQHYGKCDMHKNLWIVVPLFWLDGVSAISCRQSVSFMVGLSSYTPFIKHHWYCIVHLHCELKFSAWLHKFQNDYRNLTSASIHNIIETSASTVPLRNKRTIGRVLFASTSGFCYSCCHLRPTAFCFLGGIGLQRWMTWNHYLHLAHLGWPQMIEKSSRP